MKNEGLDKLKNEAVNALVRWGKTGLGLYSMRNAVNTYMKACGADNIPFDGINGIREKRKIVSDGLLIHSLHLYPENSSTKWKWNWIKLPIVQLK